MPLILFAMKRAANKSQSLGGKLTKRRPRSVPVKSYGGGSAGGQGWSTVEQVGPHVGVGGSSAGMWALLAEALTAAGGTGIAKVTDGVGSVTSRALGLGAPSKMSVV
jgi:hypothetical protein